MRDYYKEFVDISLQQCREDDYLDPKKIRAHNIAMRKMKRLQRELQSNGVTDFCQKLLKHEDDRVRMNAAVLWSTASVLQDGSCRDVISYST